MTPRFPDPDMCAANGLTFAVYRSGPAPDQTDKPPVLFLHGWPELAYSWRYQFPALAAAGYPVIAYDARGYGRSDKPEGVASYRIDRLAADADGLLQALAIDKAVIVGHDWGALVTWAMPFFHPERILALAGLCVPFIRQQALPPTQHLRRLFGERNYIVQFQEEGRAEPVLEADPLRTMRFLMRRPRQDRAGDKPLGGGQKGLDLIGELQGDEADWPGEGWLSEAELQVYADAFAAGGFTAPLHWYRNFDANWELGQRLQPRDGPDPSFAYPALMITADRDAACPPRISDGMERYFPTYTRVDIEGAGHWVQQEKPDRVNAALLDWLKRL